MASISSHVTDQPNLKPDRSDQKRVGIPSLAHPGVLLDTAQTPVEHQVRAEGKGLTFRVQSLMDLFDGHEVYSAVSDQDG